MSEAKGQHEPSMEEILASIRRIIAEDGEAAPAPAGAPAAAPAQAAAPRQDEILELTEVVDEEGSVVNAGAKAPEPPPAPEPLRAVEPESEPEPEPEPPPPPRAAPRDEETADRLVSDTAAAASVAALSRLVDAGQPDRLARDLPLGGYGRTLEDVVRELLRPLLRNWLDDNLPPLVERLVREEIARLVREAQGR